MTGTQTIQISEATYNALMEEIRSRGLSVHIPADTEWKRQRELMQQYKDTPMDFADASLVSLTELRGVRRIVTLDSDFYVYRINGKDTFDVIMP